MAGYLVYFALGAAALTFLITRDVRSTISVVIVAGACGIAAGTPLAILGGLALWLLRLALAPASTLAGFRAWVLEECPVAPGRRAPQPSPGRPGRGRATVPRKATKTARFLSLVAERNGLLASIPLDRVAQINAALAPQVDLNPGAARTALRKAVLTARNGDPR